MNRIPTARRTFLRQASALGLAGTAAPFALNLTALATAAAQTAPDYKALVCVFLYGANDTHNTVVPFDMASYTNYATVHGTLAWPQASLLELVSAVPQADGRRIAVPTELTPLKTLWDQGQCAVVANVGPLIVPTDRTSFLANSVPLPAKLFSHNDQQSTWQAASPEGARTGWGGRFGDLLMSMNASPVFTAMSTSGNAVFVSGNAVQQYSLDPTKGSIAFNGVNNALYGSTAGSQALKTVLARGTTQLFASDLAQVNQRSIDANVMLSAALAAAPALKTTFTSTNSLSTQLQIVARVISARTQLAAKRQVFIVSLGGFDTHNNQANVHPGLLSTVATAISEFQAAMTELTTTQQVTLFTASDFGRTLVNNGDGTDHGWGAHHFVVGGAVKGRQMYGTYPDLTANNPRDSGNGRLIPTSSVEQYAATLGAWFGVSATDLGVVLPNLKNFTPSLGFMS